MKKLLFRNFLKDVLKMFLIVGFSLGLIIWIIQAVNFLKFITEDGHNLYVYFSYTVLNFPKIIHRILPFIFFIALFQQISNYEDKNELLVFWTHGVTKLNFVNVIISFSVVMMLLQILIGGYISPKSQNEARDYIRSSNIDYFPSLIKEGKFIDTVSNLTIFIDSKDENGVYKNILIKEDFNKDDNKIIKKYEKFNSQIIYADSGVLINQNDKKYFTLYNGEFINNKAGKISSFIFDQIDFDLSKYTSKSTTHPKIQESSSLLLLKCIKFLYNNENGMFKENLFICNRNSINDIKQEFLKRFYQPLYIPLMALICCLIIVKSKESENFNTFRFFILFLNFAIIVISEIFLRYAGFNKIGLFMFIAFPIIFFLISYFYSVYKFKVN